MYQNLDVFRTAMAMARHAGLRQAASSQNIANADTPGYRGVDPPDFADSLRRPHAPMRATRSGHLNGAPHPSSAPDGQRTPAVGGDLRLIPRKEIHDPNGNTVSLESEMLIAVDAMRAHNKAMAIYRSNLSLLRASLGA